MMEILVQQTYVLKVIVRTQTLLISVFLATPRRVHGMILVNQKCVSTTFVWPKMFLGIFHLPHEFLGANTNVLIAMIAMRVHRTLVMH